MNVGMTVVIEIESNCTHTVRNIEEALNFFWGSDGTFKVGEAAQHITQTDGCPNCKILVFEGEETRLYCSKHQPAAA